MEVQASTEVLRFHVDMGAHGARLVALAGNADDESQLDEPTDVTVRAKGVPFRF